LTERKHSAKRDAILAVLRKTKLHPGAQWVYNELRGGKAGPGDAPGGTAAQAPIPDLSLGTVYRNLALFREQGLAVSLGPVAGEERFDAITAPHPHFVCEKCGAVEDLDLENPGDFGRELDGFLAARAKNGGKIDSCRTMFYGLCERCKE